MSESESHYDPDRPEGFCPITNDDCARRDHVERLVEWLFAELAFSDGVGQQYAMWYSENFWVKDILGVVKDVLAWTRGVWDVVYADKTLTCTYGQESLVITNDIEVYNNRPSSQQVTIVW